MPENSTNPNEITDTSYLLSVFIQLEKQAWTVDSKKSLAFIICNATKNLFHYETAFFFETQLSQKQKISCVSGAVKVSDDSPYINFWNNVIHNIENQTESQEITLTSLADNLQKENKGYLTAEQVAIYTPFTLDNKVVAGVIFLRNSQWKKHEIIIFRHLMHSYTMGYQKLMHSKPTVQKKLYRMPKKKYIGLGILLLVLILFLPVRNTVVVPAEIVPIAPFPVTAPMDGVINQLFIKPNNLVTAGQKLFSLEPTDVEAQFVLAEKQWRVAEEKYRKSAQQYFHRSDERSEIEVLRAQAQKAKAEYEYMQKRVAKLITQSPQAGLIIYDNPVDLMGKPVVTGEKIMELADPNKKQIQLWVPVADAINLEKHSQVVVFLNVAPLDPLQAQVTFASYNAEERPNGGFAYRVEAKFTKATIDYRIGMQGQAKIYGERVSLFYYLFWRPISAVRQWIGF